MQILPNKLLQGYSGAKLNFINDSGFIYVRKISSSASYNERLYSQMLKLQKMVVFDNCPFKVPKLFNYGYQNDLFYFDMQYLDGLTAAHYLAFNSITNISKFCSNLINIFEYYSYKIKDNINRNDYYANIYNKINSIKSIDKYLEDKHYRYFYEGLNKLFNDKDLYFTICHGDFSLDNIIIDSSDCIYLIDFLDSPLDHFWQDISKLWVDLHGHWYERNKIFIPNWVTTYLREKIFNYISNKSPEYLRYHNFLLAMNYLRILPYAKIIDDKRNIINKINYIIDSQNIII